MSATCSWCGHPTHETTCSRTIVTARTRAGDQTAPCPCTRHLHHLDAGEWSACPECMRLSQKAGA